MAKTVKMIPATIDLQTLSPIGSVKRRRVAGYARVSTDSDEQFTSYEAQVDYYTKKITSNPEWEFVRVYSDEGISGTSVKNRDGFNEMISDALAGKIDLIVTKSISRFARNTVDTLVTLRELKAKGVEVFFEKENIHTLDSKGELFVTIMSSLAQEESRSLSQNVTWGHRKRFSDGKVTLAYGSFLGYEKGPDGKLAIVESEAETVRSIYRWFMKGLTFRDIAERLESMGIKSPMGKPAWGVSTVRSILSNEKYKGDALLQKTFTVDFLTHKHKKNEGEVQQWYVENSHPAIIPPEEWEMVRLELERRSKSGCRYSALSPLSSRLVCADCGSFLGPKVWHSTDKYRRVVWQCNGKFKGERKCGTPHVMEERIKDAFLDAFNRMAAAMGAPAEGIDAALEAIGDPSSLDPEIEAALSEMAAWSARAKALVEDNARRAVNQESWSREYDLAAGKYSEAEKRLAELNDRKADMSARIAKIKAFRASMGKAPRCLVEWDEDLFRMTVDKILVDGDGSLRFVFLDGAETLVK